MSKREHIKLLVETALRSHPKGLTYHELGVITGLSPQACGRGVKWLYEENGEVIGLPCHKNGYRVTISNVPAAKEGEASQGKHLATRLETMASRLNAMAKASPGGTFEAYVRSAARHLTMTAVDVRELVDVMEK
jgi:hypothetical protein